ncbi:MAG TPA: hypothetical protein VHV10_20095 [Ktedonobacteraceae bacterium]|nr:hypothetical protein [Ktedonobacteraceae bacterium]
MACKEIGCNTQWTFADGLCEVCYFRKQNSSSTTKKPRSGHTMQTLESVYHGNSDVRKVRLEK